MTKKLYTPAERVAELVAEHGSYRLAAKAVKMGHTYLYRIGRGQSGVSRIALRKLKLGAVARYERV